MIATKSNQHSVSNFEPSEYEVLDYLDNKRPVYCGDVEGLKLAIDEWKAQIRHYFPTCAAVQGDSQQLHEHNIYRCCHCGQTNIRYIVAVRHVPSGTNLVFGCDCAMHLEFPNFEAFKAEKLRARAAQGHARLRIWRQREAFVAQNPELKRWLDSDPMAKDEHKNNTFAADIISKLNQYGAISARQVECLISSLERDLTREADMAKRAREDEERRLTAKPAPVGRHLVTGVVLHVKAQEQQDWRRGPVFCNKMLVQLDDEAHAGSRVWLTVPSSLETTGLKGKRIELVATFSLARDNPDSLFSFGRRPAKAKVLV